MEASTYYTSGTAAYATPASSPPSSVAHHSVAHSHSLSQQQLSHSHPHAHPVLFASMHPMAPHSGWMTPTTAFMPAGPTMAYPPPHAAAMYGQWHPHSHMQQHAHMMQAAATTNAPTTTAPAAATNSATLAFHSSSSNAASAANTASTLAPSSASTNLNQRPIPQYGTPASLVSASAAVPSQSAPPSQQQQSGQAAVKAKKLKSGAVNTSPPAAHSLIGSTTPIPATTLTPLPIPSSAAVVGTVYGAGNGSVPFASAAAGEASYVPSGDLHTAEGRARLMSDIRAMINDRKRNDVKRRYLAMKDKQAALDLLLQQLKAQVDSARHTEAQLADRRQQLLDTLMHYEGRRWIEQQRSGQHKTAPITSGTGRWILCGRRKENGEVCSHPVKKAKKGQTQRHCKHHQRPALQ